MLALPGSSYVYQGEELGLPEVADLPVSALQDPIWEQTAHTSKGRDGCRVPLPWTTTGPSYGFGAGGAWLPQPTSFASYAVEAQDGAEGSTLELYRTALALRRRLLDGEELTWAPAIRPRRPRPHARRRLALRDEPVGHHRRTAARGRPVDQRTAGAGRTPGSRHHGLARKPRQAVGATHPAVGLGDGVSPVSGGGVRTTVGAPGTGTGGVTSEAGSFGGEVCWKSAVSKLTSPVFSMTVMWSRTVTLAWSARRGPACSWWSTGSWRRC